MSSLFIALKVKLFTNPSKLSLGKRIATFVSAFLTKFANQEPKYPSDWIILDIWAFLNFFVSLVAKNNSCGSSLPSKFFLFSLNVVPVLFFAAEFNLFDFVFVSFLVVNSHFLIVCHLL